MKSNLFNTAESDLIFGYDLGTTNSVLTVKNSTDVPKVLTSKSGDTTPTCVRFNDDGTHTIGREAYRERQNLNVVYSFKKYMGTDKKIYGDLTARDVAAIFTKNFIEECVSNHPEFKEVKKVQVSVPAYFDHNQIMDTCLAIEQAGYKVVDTNVEPLAAAVVYQQLKKVKGDILIFDLGGGTFDAVLMRNSPGIPRDSMKFYKSIGVNLPTIKSVLEIIDTTGDNRLGGDDIDEIAAELFIKDKGLTNVTEEEKRRIILAAEFAKKMSTDTDTINDLTFKYQYVEQAVEEVYNRCISIVDLMLKRNPNVEAHNLQCVLCGGSTKNEYIRNRLSARFSVSNDIDPDLAVGVGNSIKADLDADPEGVKIVNRLAKGIGLLGDGRIKYVVEKGAILPLRKDVTFTNKTPFSDTVTIEMYQGDRFIGDITHITSINFEGLKDFDENGKAKIFMTLVIDSTGVITSEIRSGDITVSQTLALTSEEPKKQSEEIHPEAKMYHKLAKGASKYNDAEINALLDQYKLTGERELAKRITVMMSKLAK